MRSDKVIASFATVLSASTMIKADDPACSVPATISSVATVPTDILFLLDNSTGDDTKLKMKGVIKGIRNFVSSNDWRSNMPIRIGVATFGGSPTIIAPFTEISRDPNNRDATIKTIVQAIRHIKIVKSDREASFEAMRMAVTNKGIDMIKDCSWKDFKGVTCELAWATNSARFIIHATDEDSDLPTTTAYQGTGQTSNSFCANYYTYDTKTSSYICYQSNSQFEPSFTSVTAANVGKAGNTVMYQYQRKDGTDLVLTTAFQNEIATTATALLNAGVTVHSLVSLKAGTTYTPSVPRSSSSSDGKTIVTMQFGDPTAASESSDKTQFNSAQTLANLQSKGLGNSLQAKILAAGGTMRLYDIENFTGSYKPGKGNNGANFNDSGSDDDDNVVPPYITTFYNSVVKGANAKAASCRSTATIASSSSVKTSSSATASSSTVPSSSVAPVIVIVNLMNSAAAPIASSSVAAVASSSVAAPIASSSVAAVASSSVAAPIASSSVAAVVSSSSIAPVATSSSVALEISGSSASEISSSSAAAVVPTSASAIDVASSSAHSSPQTTNGVAPPIEDNSSESSQLQFEAPAPPVEDASNESTSDGATFADFLAQQNAAAKAQDSSNSNLAPSDTSNSALPAALAITVENNSTSANTQQQQQTAATTNTTTMAVLVPAAAASAIFGLLMMRRTKAIAKDFKYAFDVSDGVAAENPLYQSQVTGRENPLFVRSSEARDTLLEAGSSF